MKRKVLFIILLISQCLFINCGPKIRIKPALFDFHEISRGGVVAGRFNILNSGNDILKVKITSTCDCLINTGDDEFILKQSEIRAVNFNFHTDDYSGETVVEFVITSTDPDNEMIFFTVHGFVKSPESEKSRDNSSQGKYEDVIYTNKFDINSKPDNKKILLFSSKYCKSCEPIINDLIKWAKNKNKQIYFYSLEDMKNKKHLYSITEKYQKNLYLLGEKKYNSSLSTPFIIYKGKIYDGKKGINSLISDKEYSRKNFFSKLNIPALLTAGILDGINPCAFTVIILLLSYLSLQLKNSSEILITGIIYISTVFITYFLIGIGLFEFIRQLSVFPIFSNILKYSLCVILIILAVISFVDLIKILQGKKEKIILKLPGILQNTIRKNIRNQMKNYRIFLGALILGFTVSVIELVCTGQIYFPVLGYMVRTNEKRIIGLLYLILYNIGFIIPLSAVFLLVYKGISSKKIGDLFARNLAIVKILFIILFIGFAVINFIF